jgi:hypothetical protein
MDASRRFISHERAASLRAMGNQFSMTLSSPPATVVVAHCGEVLDLVVLAITLAFKANASVL